MNPREELFSATKGKLRSALFRVVALLAVLLLNTEAQSKTDTSKESGKRVTKIEKVVPDFPGELLNTRHYQGIASVIFMVNEEGKNYDFILFEATHPLFGEKALEALKKWKVTPPIDDGRPRPTRHIVKVKFSQQGPVLIDRTLSEIGSSVESSRDRLLYYRVCELKDLDQLPVRVETVVPFLPLGASADVGSGMARIEFFIDKEGRVRAPGTLFSTNDQLADAAVTAVSNWRFEPPLRNGHPVVARAIQTFKFEPQGAEAPLEE